MKSLLFLLFLFKSTPHPLCIYKDGQLSLCYKGKETLISNKKKGNEYTLYGAADAAGNFFSLREVTGKPSLINHYIYEESSATLSLKKRNIRVPSLPFDLPYLGKVVGGNYTLLFNHRGAKFFIAAQNITHNLGDAFVFSCDHRIYNATHHLLAIAFRGRLKFFLIDPHGRFLALHDFTSAHGSVGAFGMDFSKNGGILLAYENGHPHYDIYIDCFDPFEGKSLQFGDILWYDGGGTLQRVKVLHMGGELFSLLFSEQIGRQSTLYHGLLEGNGGIFHPFSTIATCSTSSFPLFGMLPIGPNILISFQHPALGSHLARFFFSETKGYSPTFSLSRQKGIYNSYLLVMLGKSTLVHAYSRIEKKPYEFVALQMFDLVFLPQCPLPAVGMKPYTPVSQF